MPKLVWDRAGEHYYETGVDHGVLYPTQNGVYQKGVAWNGLISVSESPSGAESNAQYADNIKYLNLISAEEFGATVEAFTYPDEFAVCDGSAEPVRGLMLGQQTRRPFGLSYRTLLGNDLMGTEYGYKLHLIYGATASTSERAYGTVNDSPEAITFSWEVTTTPVEVSGYKPTASLTIDSTKVPVFNMAKLENILYGTDTEDPRLPMPNEVISLVGSSNAIMLTVTAPSASEQALGLSVSDMQTGIRVGDSDISGSLKYIESFAAFSTDTANQNGNFMALEITATDSDANAASVNVEMIGGTVNAASKFDSTNNLYVVRVTNKDTQSIRITAATAKDTSTKVYSLKDLTLADASSLG